MTEFSEFLRERIRTGGFTNEGALESFLLLAKQTLEAHDK